MQELTLTDRRRYEELLEIAKESAEIAKESWERIAEALTQIRDKRLYREHYPTFEAFLAGEFNKSAPWGYQIIAAWKQVKALPAGAPRPKSLKQARKLLPKRPKPVVEVEALVVSSNTEKPPAEPKKTTSVFWANARTLAGDIKEATHFRHESLFKLKRSTAKLTELVSGVE